MGGAWVEDRGVGVAVPVNLGVKRPCNRIHTHRHTQVLQGQKRRMRACFAELFPGVGHRSLFVIVRRSNIFRRRQQRRQNLRRDATRR